MKPVLIFFNQCMQECGDAGKQRSAISCGLVCFPPQLQRDNHPELSLNLEISDCSRLNPQVELSFIYQTLQHQEQHIISYISTAMPKESSFLFYLVCNENINAYSSNCNITYSAV